MSEYLDFLLTRKGFESLATNRFTLRLPDNMRLAIDERVAQSDDLTNATDFIVKAVAMALELQSLGDLDTTMEPLLAYRRRRIELDKWCERFDITRDRLLSNAVDYYLDALTVANGRPEALDLTTLITAVQSVLGQMDRLETKVDGQSRLIRNGFDSFSRLSSGVSSLVSREDNGILPEDKVDMSRGGGV